MQGLDLSRLLGRGRSAPDADEPTPDDSETVLVSALSIIKMLPHCKSGIPLEVMGLMLGNFVDSYTVRVVDSFACPQKGSVVNVEAVDPAYQKDMMELLEQVGRPEYQVGWYHSHPGYYCYLSYEDQMTQKSFEAQTQDSKAIAVVIDPKHSVRGKVDWDAFRNIPDQFALTGSEYRGTSSNIGLLHQPTRQQLVHNLGKTYYHIPIRTTQTEGEQRMLHKIARKAAWRTAVELPNFVERRKSTIESVRNVAQLTQQYAQWICDGIDEQDVFVDESAKKNAKVTVNPAIGLKTEAAALVVHNIDEMLSMMLVATIFA